MVNLDVWYDEVTDRWMRDDSSEEDGWVPGSTGLPQIAGTDPNALGCFNGTNPAIRPGPSPITTNDTDWQLLLESCSQNVNPDFTSWEVQVTGGGLPNNSLLPGGVPFQVQTPNQNGLAVNDLFVTNPAPGTFTINVDMCHVGGDLNFPQLLCNYIQLQVIWEGAVVPPLPQQIQNDFIEQIKSAYGGSDHQLAVASGNKPATALRSYYLLATNEIDDEDVFGRVTADDDIGYTRYIIPVWFLNSDAAGLDSKTIWVQFKIASSASNGQVFEGTITSNAVFGGQNITNFSFTVGTNVSAGQTIDLQHTVDKITPSFDPDFTARAYLQMTVLPPTPPASEALWGINWYSTYLPLNLPGTVKKRLSAIDFTRYGKNPDTVNGAWNTNLYTRPFVVKDGNLTNFTAEFFPSGSAFFSEPINAKQNEFAIMGVDFNLTNWQGVYDTMAQNNNANYALTNTQFVQILPPICVQFKGDLWIWPGNPIPAGAGGTLTGTPLWLENNTDALVSRTAWQEIPKQYLFIGRTAGGAIRVSFTYSRALDQTGEKLRIENFYLLHG